MTDPATITGGESPAKATDVPVREKVTSQETETPLWLKAATEGASAEDGYLIDLELFQGPMELLLYLIRKDELDLNDIPIARITKQYLGYVEMIKDLNLEAAGDFILMAATLIRIKTKMLLPREELDSEEPDPREELVMALLEYKRFKEASETLREMREREDTLFVPERKISVKGHTTEIPASTLFQLIEALKEALGRTGEDHSHVTRHEKVTIESRVERIRQLLAEQETTTLPDLFADAPTKLIIIVTIIAILEMVNARRLKVRQVGAFSELRVYRGESFFDPGEIIVDEWAGAADATGATGASESKTESSSND
ncbi:MAG: segregation and condensation protein A [Candidatus Zixiibacteriota bacterium]